MPKRVTKGVGLMQRTVVQYSPDDDPDAFLPGGEVEAAFAKCQTADGYRDANAVHVRKLLSAAYSKMDPAWFCRNAPQHTEAIRADMERRPALYVKAYFGEDHAYAIMQQWLDRYDALAAERANSAPDVRRLVELGEELGKLYERLYWRAGIDPASGERREALALTGRPVKLGQRDGAKKTNKAHGAKRQERFARMERLIPEIGVENAARQCEAEGLGGWQGIERQWNRFREKNPDT